MGLFSGLRRSSTVPAGSFANAASVGAKTVNGPADSRVVVRSAADSAAASVLKVPAACAVATMFLGAAVPSSSSLQPESPIVAATANEPTNTTSLCVPIFSMCRSSCHLNAGNGTAVTVIRSARRQHAQRLAAALPLLARERAVAGGVSLAAEDAHVLVIRGRLETIEVVHEVGRIQIVEELPHVRARALRRQARPAVAQDRLEARRTLVPERPQPPLDERVLEAGRPAAAKTAPEVLQAIERGAAR